MKYHGSYHKDEKLGQQRGEDQVEQVTFYGLRIDVLNPDRQELEGLYARFPFFSCFTIRFRLLPHTGSPE